MDCQNTGTRLLFVNHISAQFQLGGFIMKFLKVAFVWIFIISPLAPLVQSKRCEQYALYRIQLLNSVCLQTHEFIISRWDQNCVFARCHWRSMTHNTGYKRVR